MGREEGKRNRERESQKPIERRERRLTFPEECFCNQGLKGESCAQFAPWKVLTPRSDRSVSVPTTEVSGSWWTVAWGTHAKCMALTESPLPDQLKGTS